MCQGAGDSTIDRALHHGTGKGRKMRTPKWTPEGVAPFQIQHLENTPKSFFWEVHVLRSPRPRASSNVPQSLQMFFLNLSTTDI